MEEKKMSNYFSKMLKNVQTCRGGKRGREAV